MTDDLPVMEQDSPWKEIIEHYFPEFSAFFFPAVHDGIDWSIPYDFLDKELQQVVRDAETGIRRVDKLVRVWLKNGMETWIMIHIEIQGQQDKEFSKRMFVYHYRVFDRYDIPVVSLAVLTDEQVNWRPSHYGYDILGCKVSLEFPIVKLLDYQTQWPELEKSDNPFAVAVMAQLRTQATRKDMKERYSAKLMLAKGLYKRGFDRKNILELFRFIDWIMALPEELTHQFDEDMVQYELEIKMPYVTSIERRGIQKGLEQGLEQGLETSVLRILTRKFGEVPAEIEARIRNLPLDVLEPALDESLNAESLSDFEQRLSGLEN